jgi:hypothetical protein
MPKWLHDRLERQAKAKGLSGERKKGYIYGTLQKHEKRKAVRRKTC